METLQEPDKVAAGEVKWTVSHNRLLILTSRGSTEYGIIIRENTTQEFQELIDELVEDANRGATMADTSHVTERTES